MATTTRTVGQWAVRTLLECFLVTARKRSLGQGNIFTPVCHSVHRGVCLSACWDTTPPRSRHPPWSRSPPRSRSPQEKTPPDQPPREQSMLGDMNHPTELREKTFQHSQKASRNFCRKLNLLFRFKLEKYLCIIVAVLPLIAKM